MKLDFVPLNKLTDSKANMRCGRKAPDVSDLIPSVRARGILQPIIVRPQGEGDLSEVVAGRRRWHAALAVAAEHPDAVPDHIALVPAAIIEPGDDAAALEASMLENMARLDPDEVKQWESFTALVKKGRSVEDIATTFGLPEQTIRRVLALGNLMPRIRDLYRREEIDATTVRHLTMASKAKQQEWLALIDDPDTRAPTGQYLKSWLLGGQTIQTGVALFDIAEAGGPVVTTLFGDDAYFGDPQSFWAAQNAAVEARRDAYLAEGWTDVVVVEPSEHFHSWEYEKSPKRKGGKVYIDVRSSGEVTFHEGYLSRNEARKREKAGQPGSLTKVARPEISSTMQTYIDLHRHSAVRADLLKHPSVALRLMVAHAIVGSHLWRVSPDPRTCRNDAVTESAEGCDAEASFDQERRAVLGLLDFSAEEPNVTGGNGDKYGVAGVFLRLLAMEDNSVMRIIPIIMGETLVAGSAAIEAVGGTIGTDMANWWAADAAFFDLIRDKEVMARIVADVAGERVASANAGEKTKTLKAIVRGYLDGADGRTKVERWVPRWMRFAPSGYTERGGIGTVKAHAKVEAARAALAEAEAGPMAEPEEQRLAA
ncbi:ParB/RepB/Spo0J family partition protein [Sphingomonas oligoaromativorans]|uniref:ParB/RepB/Spo0J family partition protein n=1 Tax=Sphingomonas oligoaromativorans TaxID=575322 RepID=UPI0014243338|nr:ParB N-terminal domain-containing protein [Sphingomonas oligoaromativorans]NIJ34087.1 ParB family chromosome partitioning protein [Sphingomonas oligoaromativorans]